MTYTYECFYNRQTKTISAASLYDAKLAAIQYFKVPKSKQGLLAVVLSEIDGKPREVNTVEV